MLTRFSRILIVFAAAGVAYAGPVTACVCVAALMEEMPCCPDAGDLPDQSACIEPTSELSAACEPAPTDLLPAGTLDLSSPVAISAAFPPWSVHGPPDSSIAISPPPHDFPPIYLITLRLRI